MGIKKNIFAPLFKGLGATRRSAVLLLVMMLTSTTAWAQSTETLGGYTFTIGTDGDGQYYIVDCEAALRALSSYSTSNNCSGKRFVQTADITLTGTFAPIGGNSSSNTQCFKGTYDGGGHTISGLQVEVTSSNFSSASAGLFSAVKENGLVRNVGLIAPSVSCSCSGKGCRAGAIAGYVEYGTITNCFVLNPGTIMASNGSENYTGLFIGQKNGGTYANLYYYGTTALPMCGKNDLGNNHIERIYKVTAGSNAGLPTRAATEGFIAQGSHYYREGATVQLSYTGSNPNSYRPVYSVSPTNTGASVTEQGVLTMGNGDITITATLSNIPLINISTGTIADIADQAYTGSAIVPDITLTVGGKVLTAGSDYLVSCTNNVNVGTATLTATGQGNYTGTLTKNFRIYYADMTGSCGTNVTYTLHDEDQNGHYEQLIISGTGAMTDFNDPDDVPWAAYLDDITSVIVQSGVTHIGAFAFYFCRNLTSVSLSEGLTSIGLSAFKYCYRLSALTVPASVESVGSNSFESLALSVSGGTLTFASGSRLTSVGNDAFYFAHASVDMSACTRLTAMPKAFQYFDKDVTFPHSLTSIAANCFYGNNSKDAKVYVHVPDNYVLTVNDVTISATNGKADITSAIGVGQNHAAVTLSCTPDPAHFSVNGDGSYTIHTATGWNVFCDLLADNDKGYFSGKTVKLGADITVSRMAGSSYHDFTGTFDGDGHTLTVSYGTVDAPFSEQYAAPFRYLEDGCVIKNLHVAGHIYTSAKYAAGLAGSQYGDVTIQNCRSSVTIHSSVENANSDGTHGGFIAYFGGQHKHLSFEGCVFDGKLLTTNGTSHCGGFVGWANGVSNSTDTEVTFTNCLYAPAAIADGEAEVGSSESATFARKNSSNTVTLTITNSYYTRALGTAQGTKPIVTASKPSNIGDEETAYNVSGITAYANGLLYDSEFYCGDSQFGEIALAYSGSSLTATIGASTATVSIPEDVIVSSVTYERTFTDGRPSTVMLPFSLGEGQTLTGGVLYKFQGVQYIGNSTWEAILNETSTLQANTPYLLMPDNELVDGKVTFNLNNSTVTLNTNGGGNRMTADEGSHWTFKGTYEYMKWTNDSNDPEYDDERAAEIGRAYGFAGVAKDGLSLGDFVKVTNGAKIRPMSCYLLWNDIPNSANARSFTRGAAATDEELPQRITVRLVGSNGETTGIGTLDTKTGEMTFDSEAWYTLDGVRLSGKPTKKGLYINNGRKIVIK